MYKDCMINQHVPWKIIEGGKMKDYKQQLTQWTGYRPLFYSAWLILHLVQGSATELFDDEAYYWVYSLFSFMGLFRSSSHDRITYKSRVLYISQ